MCSVNTISTLADIQCCKNLQELYIRLVVGTFLVFLCFKCVFSFQKEPNPWYRWDPLAEGFAETEESVSDLFLTSKVHVCTLKGGVSLPDMFFPILSWWHLARNSQSLTLQGESHHNKSRWLEENPCAESVGPELYRQENKQEYKKYLYVKSIRQK